MPSAPHHFDVRTYFAYNLKDGYFSYWKNSMNRNTSTKIYTEKADNRLKTQWSIFKKPSKRSPKRVNSEKILIVDDDRSILTALDKFFRKKSFKPLLAVDGNSALEIFSSERPSVVMADIRLPGNKNGIDVVQRIKEIDSETSTIFMTGNPAQQFILDGLKMGATDFLTKPLNNKELNKAVERILSHKKSTNKKDQQTIELKNLANKREEELKQMQREHLQSAKMSALGELSAGLAHEVNQPLTALKLTCQEALFSLVDENISKTELRESLEDMLRHMEMISDIVRNMRTFARSAENDSSEKFEINQLINDILSLTSFQLKKYNIQVNLELSNDLPLLESQPVKLQQVLMNLISNARDALKQCAKSSKQLTLSTYLREKGNCSYIVISVKDNAMGIPKNIQDKIFLPLFTTKDRSAGTGLGLSISKKLIDGMNGKIELTTEEREGTCFSIILPILEEKELPKAA